MVISLLCWFLKRKNLSRTDRVRLVNSLLSTVGALPLHATITEDGGSLSIKGVPLDGERMAKIRENASAVLHNQAWQAVHEQALYLAVSLGIHKSQDFDQTMFAKAAIWFGEQERELLQTLAQAGTRELVP